MRGARAGGGWQASRRAASAAVPRSITTLSAPCARVSRAGQFWAGGAVVLGAGVTWMRVAGGEESGRGTCIAKRRFPVQLRASRCQLPTSADWQNRPRALER